MTEILEGGCHCGAVRFRVTAAPLVVTHCHCQDCRRASGAPFMTWMSLASEAFAYTKGAPKIHKSSATGNRAFCGACGSSLAYHNDAHPEEIDVSAASLDDPNAVTPQDHIWSASMLSWVKLDDGLPRLAKTHWESGYPGAG